MDKLIEDKKIRVLRLLHRNPMMSHLRIRMHCALGNESMQILRDMLFDGLLNIVDDDAGSKGLYSVTSKGVSFMRN